MLYVDRLALNKAEKFNIFTKLNVVFICVN